MIYAEIISGATGGSTSLVVSAPTAADGTQVVVYRGRQLVASGPLAGGIATLTFSIALSAGDLIQASLTSRGNNCGLPVQVASRSVLAGEWLSPTEIRASFANGEVTTLTVDQFGRMAGYVPAAVEDPAGVSAIVLPEYIPQTDVSISFDLQVERQGGTTSVTIQNVQNVRGGIVTKWSGDSVWGNVLSKDFTTNQTVTIQVKGSQNTNAEALSRNVTIVIQAPPPATPAPDPKIRFYSWNLVAGQLILVNINSDYDVQVRCPESDSGEVWFDANVYNNSHERQCYLPGLPLTGPVTVQIRVRDEADSAKWVTMSFTKYA